MWWTPLVLALSDGTAVVKLYTNPYCTTDSAVANPGSEFHYRPAGFEACGGSDDGCTVVLKCNPLRIVTPSGATSFTDASLLATNECVQLPDSVAIDGAIFAKMTIEDGFVCEVPPPPPGPPGPVGATGAVGPAGPVGATGAVGPAGPVGATGAVGPAGPVGATGAVGPAGADGADGAVGQAGPAGPAGPAGSVGPVGPAGPAGSVGPAGPKGETGERGFPGANAAAMESEAVESTDDDVSGQATAGVVLGAVSLAVNIGLLFWVMTIQRTISSGYRPTSSGFNM